LAAQVRVAVPASIAQLVKFYNSCTEPSARRDCETACRDILGRLEHLVLSSDIEDTARKDIIRSRIKIYSSKSSNNSNPISIEKTRRFATESRISVVMLARCKSKHIRDKSMCLLCEALDTNILSTDKHEVMQLQMIWVELVQMFRHVIDARRYNKSCGKQTTENRNRMSRISHLSNSVLHK
jgi:hypothetical protein